MNVHSQNKSGKDQEEIFRFVSENSFGTMINLMDERPVATHIPMELFEKENGRWIIQCHIAKANPHWKCFDENNNTLCIFTGPHSYISPSWYSSVNVPTWNYMSVHFYGSSRILDNMELFALLKKQIDTYESNRENPIKIENYDPGLIEKMMRAVVGIEITVTDIQAKYKPSQNRSEQDFANVIHQLEKSDNYNSNEMKNEMKKLKNSKLGFENKQP